MGEGHFEAVLGIVEKIMTYMNKMADGTFLVIVIFVSDYSH
jgi:hypothetical protein